MADHTSLMLDSMFTVVDEGFSYDGIVSVPRTGLEDRARLTVLLHDGVDLGRMARIAILRGATRMFRGQPQYHVGPALALPETVVQAPARHAEDSAQAPNVNASAQPGIIPLGMVDHNLPDTGLRQAQGIAGDNEEGMGIEACGASSHTRGHNLPPRQETATHRAQLAIGLVDDNDEELGIQSNVAPSYPEDRDLPVRQEAMTERARTVIRISEDDEERQGIQTGLGPLFKEDYDPSVPIPKESATEKDHPRADPHLLNRSRARSIVLVATCTITMIVNASNITSVSIALPEIGKALNIRQGQLQWLLSAYSLGAGCLLLFFERLAGLYGHKRAFFLGMTWQAGFALGCGFSSNGITLDVLRGLQGVGMAAAISSAVRILLDSFAPFSRSTSVALAIFSAGAPVGAALGMIIGCVLTELSTEHWRSPFFLSAALSAPCLIGGLISFDKDRILLEVDRRVDWIGVVLVTCGLALIVFALGQGPIAGWKTHYIIACLLAGVCLVGIFFLWERHLEKTPEERRSIWRPPPLMKPSIWIRARGRVAATLAIVFLTWCSFTCWVLWVQLYYQYYLQLSPIRTVVRFIPMFVADLLCYFFTPMLAARVPLVVLVVYGALNTGAACVLFAQIDPSVTYWAFSFSSTVLIVIGVDIIHLACAMYITRNTKPGEENLFQTMVRIGAAFGLVVSTIAFNSVVVTVSNVPTSVELQGYKAAQWTGAGFSFLAALLAVIFLRGTGIAGYGGYNTFVPSLITRLMMRWRGIWG